MPQPIIPKRQTREEIVAASKMLAPNINRPGDWIPNPKHRPNDPNSNEPRMILNPARKKRPTKTEDRIVTTGTRTNLEKLIGRAKETRPRFDLEQAARAGSKKAEEERKRKKEKDVGRAKRKKEVKETPFGLRTVRGRAMLKAPAEEALKTRKKSRQERIAGAVGRSTTPVTRTDLPTPKVTDPVKLKRLSDAIAATKRREAAPAKPRYSTEASKKLKQLVDENEREKERKKDNDIFGLSWDRKIGGKVSRRSGGKIMVGYKAGGKV